MTNEQPSATEVAKLIESQFELTVTTSDRMEVLKAALEERISWLLTHDPDHLKWILYRIDVSEKKVLEALANNPANLHGTLVAELVIERQLSKIKTRKEYGSDWRAEEEA